MVGSARVDDELEVDLSSMVSEQRAQGRTIRLSYAGVAVAGSVAIIAGIGYTVLRGLSALSLALMVVGGGFLVVGTLVIRLMNVSIQGVRVNERGVEFILSNGQSKLLQWTDPRFQLELVDLNSVSPSSRVARTAPTKYGIGSRRVGESSSIPQPLYTALLSRCEMHGMYIVSNTIPGGNYAGAIQHIITGHSDR